MTDSNRFRQQLLADLRVELTEEFDKNFERKAFFSERWKQRRYANPKGSLLMVTGTMRRSIRSEIRGNGVRFTSAVPYAAVHNEGGTIRQNVKSHTRRGRGGKSHRVRAHTRTVRMTQRRFIGDGPHTRDIIKGVIDENLKAFGQQIGRQLRK